MRSIAVLLLLIFPTLLHATDLTYVGAFRLPGGTGRQFTFGQSGGPLAYRPKTGNLIIRGHNQYNEFLEVKIPDMPLDGKTATAVGAWFDPTRGTRDPAWPAPGAGTQTAGTAGCYIDADDNLFGTIGIWYNVSNLAVPSVYSTNLTDGTFKGYWKTTGPMIKVSGYIHRLPKQLRELWSQEIMLANTSGSGTSATTAGPGLYSVTSYLGLAAGSAISEQPRITWTQTPDPYLYGANKRPWSKGSSSGAMNAADGVSQANAVATLPWHVVWFGRNASDNAGVWYGNAPLVEGGVTYTDPCTTAKGYHATKYTPKLFVAHVTDIAEGRKTISEIDLSPWCKTACGVINGTVDEAGGQMFVLEARADAKSYQSGMPLIHVFTFTPESQVAAEIAGVEQEITNLDEQLAALTARRNAAADKLTAAQADTKTIQVK